jgi:hypothetical protein
MPKRGVKRGKGGGRIDKSKDRHEIHAAMHEQESKLESATYQLCAHLGIGEEEIENIPDAELVSFFRTQIQSKY